MSRWMQLGGRIAFLLLCAIAMRTPGRAQTAQPPTVLWVNCGGEGERPCMKDEPNKGWGLLPANTPSDNWNNGNDTLRCDSGLQIHFLNSTTRCVLLNRMAVGETDPNYNPPWTTFARQNQFNSVEADQPITFANILGTHNSYSNYFDGAQSQLSTDQGFSITDQLQYGSRVIRLDPWLFTNTDFQVKLCHSSSFNITTSWMQSIDNFFGVSTPGNINLDARGLCDIEDPLGNHLSLNRSFIFAVKELGHWLRQHPGEVALLYLHDHQQGWEDVTKIAGIVSAGPAGLDVNTAPIDPELYYYAAISAELGDMVYQNPFVSAGSWNKNFPPADFRFPTLRQMRAMNKQVLVISDYASNLAFQAFDGTGMLTIQERADELTQDLCNPGSSSSIYATHGPQTFAETGEDRTLSNPYQARMMDAPRLRGAMHCGLNEIELDFLGTLDQAPNPHLLTEALSPLLGVLVGVTADLQSQNFQCNDFSQGNTCSTTDYRREASIWSWAPNSGQHGLPVMMTTSSGDSFASWVSTAATTQAPYLCAKPGTASDMNGTYTDGTYPDNKQWAITSASGSWFNGESACQKEKGAGWHFWHPTSAVQQDQAYGALQTSGNSGVWINHTNSSIVALPQNVTLPLGSPAQTIVVSGGLGGQLTATANSPYIQVSAAPFYATRDTKQASDNNDGNLFAVSLTSQAGTLQPGNYQFTVTIHETATLSAVNPGADPQIVATGGDAQVIVNVTIPRAVVHIPANQYKVPVIADGVSHPTPIDFQWTAGSSHTLSFATASLGTGKQAVFTQWSDGDTSNPRTITAADGDTFSGAFVEQFDVTTSINIAGAGQVTPSTWVDAGGTLQITATANGGYGFTGFSGDMQASTSPTIVSVNSPMNVVANFTPAQPKIVVTATLISDNDPLNVELGIGLSNVGLGAAAPLIVSATATVTSGTGTVTPIVFPAAFIQGNSSTSIPVSAVWPLTAKRIQLTVSFTANGGAYRGSQVLNLFR